MEDVQVDNLAGSVLVNSPLELRIDYESCLNEKKFASGRRFSFDYDGCKIGFTAKQIKALKFVAKGYSNQKIAHCLGMKESSIKLLIYRIMKYLEKELSENVDRFYLVIIAQQLELDNYKN